MRKFTIYVFVLIILATSVYAEVIVSQPSSVYSLGDKFLLSVTLSSAQKADGNLKMSLSCNNNSNDLYLSPISVTGGQDKKVDIDVSLTRAFLGDMKGNCAVIVSSPVGDAVSQSFEISDKIEIVANPSKLGFSAGDTIEVKGTVKKPNSKPVSGFVEMMIEGTDVKIVKPVSSENFDFSFVIPSIMKSGAYNLRFTVYEKDSNGEITNTGIAEGKISVAKVSQKIEVSIAAQSVAPGSDVSFKILMYDQANEEVPGDATVRLLDPEGEIIAQKLVKTDEIVGFGISSNATPGYWKIEALHGNLSVKRLFYVENQETASFEIVGDTLYIRNIGNSPYNKAIQIAIGDDVEVKEMQLEVGEEKKYRLVAPDGIYKVSVTDGKQSINVEGVSLTGNAIGVFSESGGSVFVRYPLVWIFIIIVFGMFVLMMFERFADRRFISYNMPEAAPIEIKKQWNSGGFGVGGVREAEHAVSLNGHKEEAALVAFKIKNMHELNNENLKNIENIFGAVYDRKGVVYKTGNYLVLIFTPSVTKTFKNNVNAIKAAKEMGEQLEAYNKKYARKIDYGIGLNYGSIVVEPMRDKLRFASVGNALNMAKRIADISHGEVLLSKDVNTHIDSEIKTERANKEGLDVYALKKVTSREDYHGFLQGFLNRNK